MKLYIYIYISSTIIGSSFSYRLTLSSLKVIEKTNKFIFCSFSNLYLNLLMILPKISRLVWVSNAGGCKIWSWKQRISQRRPVETGQRSSDDEVSKLILHDRKREFFWRKLKMFEWLTSSLESVYIVFVERLLICLVIVAMVEGCNRSSLLVSVLYRPNEEFSE